MNKADNNDLLWRQYNLNVDLYKHYLDLVLKFNAFYYAVTGAILSFYFTNLEAIFIKYSLLFPTILSLCFGSFFIYGGKLMFVVRDEVYNIRDKLNLEAAPEMKVLSVLLFISAGLFFIVSICMGLLFFFSDSLINNNKLLP